MQVCVRYPFHSPKTKCAEHSWWRSAEGALLFGLPVGRVDERDAFVFHIGEELVGFGLAAGDGRGRVREDADVGLGPPLGPRGEQVARREVDAVALGLAGARAAGLALGRPGLAWLPRAAGARGAQSRQHGRRRLLVTAARGLATDDDLRVAGERVDKLCVELRRGVVGDLHLEGAGGVAAQGAGKPEGAR